MITPTNQGILNINGLIEIYLRLSVYVNLDIALGELLSRDARCAFEMLMTTHFQSRCQRRRKKKRVFDDMIIANTEPNNVKVSSTINKRMATIKCQ